MSTTLFERNMTIWNIYNYKPQKMKQWKLVKYVYSIFGFYTVFNKY